MFELLGIEQLLEQDRLDVLHECQYCNGSGFKVSNLEPGFLKIAPANAEAARTLLNSLGWELEKVLDGDRWSETRTDWYRLDRK